MSLFIFGSIEFAVADAASGAHAQDFSWMNNRSIAHAVLVFQRAVQKIGDDFHVAVRVGRKPCTRGDAIIIDDT